MKPREQGGVVDARLNVYGTQNLKVAGMFFACSLFRRHEANAAHRL
jgi:hypothetical protein